MHLWEGSYDGFLLQHEFGADDLANPFNSSVVFHDIFILWFSTLHRLLSESLHRFAFTATKFIFCHSRRVSLIIKNLFHNNPLKNASQQLIYLFSFYLKNLNLLIIYF